MKIKVDRTDKVPLYWQIYKQLKNLILEGYVIEGTVLPSERTMAASIGVHRNTIIKAYAALKDDEYITSRQGVGYVVTYISTDYNYEQDVRKRVNWNSIIKEQYLDIEKTFDDMFIRINDDSMISFASGMPSLVYDERDIALDIVDILNNESTKPFFFTPYQGDELLRHKLSQFFRLKGINATPNQVQILSETNQALDFIFTAMLNSGDTVITEEPVSPDIYRAIELAGGKVITVPVDEDGMLCENIGPLIEKNKPKFILVNSSYHDPTGNIMSLTRRKKILELSNRYRLPIIEEDAASELGFTELTLPSLKSMDFSDNVIYIYSFSLTFIPGLSVAAVVASEKVIKSLSYLVSVRMVSLDWITQKLLSKYISDGTYSKKVKEIVELNEAKKNLMCSYLDSLRDIDLSYEIPRGGVYIWCKLPPRVNVKELVKRLQFQHISVIPGRLFYPRGNGGLRHIRMNYSYESMERITSGMEKFVGIVRELAELRLVPKK